MKTVLITGGSGFIGRHLQESLAEDYRILCPSHRELDLTEDMAVRGWFAEHRPDMVIHGATKPGHRNAADPSGVFVANTRMFSALWEASRELGVERFLFLGSGSEYDMRHYQPKMSEDYLGQHIPSDETGFSKYLCSRMMAGTPGAVNLRFFGVFGRYEDYAIRFISNAICKVLFGLPITLRQNRRFDYVCVEDGVSVIRRFLELPMADLLYDQYNVTPEASVELLALAELVRSVAGVPEHPILVAEEGCGVEYSGDNRRLREQFPDLVFTPMAEAVEALYRWYFERRDDLSKECLMVDK